MVIRKYIPIPKLKFLRDLENFYKLFLNSLGVGYKITDFRGYVKTADTVYNFDHIGDWASLVQRLKYVEEYYISISFDNKNASRYSLELQQSQNLLFIDVGSTNIIDIEKSLSYLEENYFKRKYYKYNTRQTDVEHRRQMIGKLLHILESADELQVRSLTLIENEKNFQNFLYPVLRSHFEDLEDEHYLPKYGSKTYKPDFGIPSAKLLLEVKFIKSLNDLKRCQAEIHDDIIGYLGSSDKYKTVVVIIYNYNNIAINNHEIKQIEGARGISRVVVCSHVVPNNLFKSIGNTE